MQFMVIGKDGKDPEALTRRKKARQKHLETLETMLEEGTMLFAAALVDEKGTMKGSMVVCDFPSRKELEEWLIHEPYVVGGVWKNIDIQECKVGKPFEKLVKPSIYNTSNFEDLYPITSMV